jgi:hypothetical protein
VKTAAQTMRANPKLDVEQAITELGVGEALVSLLDEKGRPGVTERAWVYPPASKIGPITPDERQAIIKGSAIFGHYEKVVDRESAFEKLQAGEKPGAAKSAAGKGAEGKAGDAPAGEESMGEQVLGTVRDFLFGKTGPRGGRREGVIEQVAKSEARKILRGALGSVLGGRRR